METLQTGKTDEEKDRKRSYCFNSCGQLLIILLLILAYLEYSALKCTGGYCDVATMITEVVPYVGIFILVLAIFFFVIAKRSK